MTEKHMMDKGQLQEMKIRMKYQKDVDQILEDADEDEYGDQLDLDSDEEEAEEDQVEVKEINEEVKSAEEKEDEEV